MNGIQRLIQQKKSPYLYAHERRKMLFNHFDRKKWLNNTHNNSFKIRKKRK